MARDEKNHRVVWTIELCCITRRGFLVQVMDTMIAGVCEVMRSRYKRVQVSSKKEEEIR